MNTFNLAEYIKGAQPALAERLFSNLGVSLCENAIEIAGQKLVPDETKAYIRFKISHPFPIITAYGTALHPGTVANSYASMLHQVFNEAHKMRAYDPTPEKKEIPRDYILGSIVALEFPRAPMGGWKMSLERDKAPFIDAAAVIHKNAEHVQKIFGEHLSGRHKWTVSMEVQYSLRESGFIMMGEPRARQKEMLAAHTPEEFSKIGLHYIPLLECPDDLLECYSLEKRRVVKDWNGLQPVLLKGGINGSVHYGGVGLVKYGAEREAEVQQLLASDPDALSDVDLKPIAEHFKNFAENGEKVLTDFTKAVQRDLRRLD